MGTLFKRVRGRGVLHAAWKHVRESGQSSQSDTTRKKIAEFEQTYLRGLDRISRALQKDKFRFRAQVGIAARKAGGKPGRRPIVDAPVENRIVQRAILEVLQGNERLPGVPQVQQVLATSTSVGGVPGRNVGHALSIVKASIKCGAAYYVRSDIKDFFTRIPRDQITSFVSQAVDDPEFTNLFAAALKTELENLEKLGEHRGLFPLGPDGVAQGSALSPLAGNILLREFDAEMNDRRITCVRYIDDFILLGPDESSVSRAFASARRHLQRFGMDAYLPHERPDKAKQGPVTKGIEFLGYELHPGLLQPAKKARESLLKRVDDAFRTGRENLKLAEAAASSADVPRHRYIHTMKYVSDILHGWGHAFKYCTNTQVLDFLDREIDAKITSFSDFARKMQNRANQQTRRRVLGVHLLCDTPLSNLP